MSKVRSKGSGRSRRYMKLIRTGVAEQDVPGLPAGTSVTVPGTPATVEMIWVSKWANTNQVSEDMRADQRENRPKYNFEILYRGDINTNDEFEDTDATGTRVFQIVSIFDPTGMNRILQGIMEEKAPSSR